jgi:hypothetical protein
MVRPSQNLVWLKNSPTTGRTGVLKISSAKIRSAQPIRQLELIISMAVANNCLINLKGSENPESFPRISNTNSVTTPQIARAATIAKATQPANKSSRTTTNIAENNLD